MFTIFSLFFHTYFPRSCGQRAKIEVTHCHILIRAALTVIEAAATIKPVTIRGCILRIYQSRVPVLKKATMAMCWTWWSIGYIVHFRGVECFKCSFRRQNWAEFLVFWIIWVAVACCNKKHCSHSPQQQHLCTVSKNKISSNKYVWYHNHFQEATKSVYFTQ